MNVTLVDRMGSDLTVCNSARVSMGKHHDVLDDSDHRLLQYLARHGHISPFFHPQMTVRVEAPIFVARQLFRHQIGISVNEASRRYVDACPTFFVPKTWRSRPPQNIKQGSGPVLDPELQSTVAELYDDLLAQAAVVYRDLIGLGVAPEQARMALPQSTYTEWYWTGSLYGFFRVVTYRIATDAQEETREIAILLSELLMDWCPLAYQALVQWNPLSRQRTNGD